MTDQIEELMSQADSLGSLGVVARQQGEEAAADAHFREAFGLALDAADQTGDGGSRLARLDILRKAARFALDCGEVMEARRVMDEACSAEASTKFEDAWLQLRDVTAWPDTWLIAAVRRDPPDERALDAGYPNDDEESVALVDRIPDLKALSPENQTLLAMDIDKALEQLPPQLREVLVARFITGESCAEIGHRYGRTEQSISGWVRQALREMKLHLERESRGAAVKA